ncbi:MAG: hypothetical protein EOS54_28065 [Mesorhizobium sp.]|uniref:transposase n=1 Tax=unclassified Mesorhizobium TaxID=325217 RepID=UPI000FD264D8|nr:MULTISPECIES: transposase [unclassified Mesorhizobium]RVD44724.1 hypothetical protein EN742_01275 [Mesorhizobium sp. M4A.F.Ca.ET.020.02.1.1]RWC08909.1 MAG: hypothetical protein EOS53_31325 [Mesorhizobium sp.]RWC38319.1 MAG: hypothetical protein EOS54_28065 [Mesorhizobium sp.]RWD39983.1 MAG: hypothetical protein EOS35_33040 [Mesorhizobium sp.]TIL55571.1 MAG: hypothetical protein E5Y79_33795 [Mesorhizobium sp.]
MIIILTPGHCGGSGQSPHPQPCRAQPAEARRIVKRLEFHYTPKYGSWLNMAELQFAILSRQCLGRYLPHRTVLHREIAAWEAERNRTRAKAHWQFNHHPGSFQTTVALPCIIPLAKD